jgi:hypothetical protein
MLKDKVLNMNIYIYSHKGDRVDQKDDDIYSPAFLPGHQDNAAICKAENKLDAIKKFLKFFTNASLDNVYSLDELYWVPGDDVALLTTY